MKYKILFLVLGFLAFIPFAFSQGLNPVECKFVKVDNKAEVIYYEVKINSEKPLHQADLKMKQIDASGKILSDSPFIWQNIVKSQKQPIEKGKTYTDKWIPIDAGVVKGECRVTTVWFDDGTQWNASYK